MNKVLASGMTVSAIITSLLGFTQVSASERPPANAKPLVEIIETLEAQGYDPITEISLDDGIWEVEAYRNNQERELKVHPVTGEILSDRLDD